MRISYHFDAAKNTHMALDVYPDQSAALDAMQARLDESVWKHDALGRYYDTRIIGRARVGDPARAASSDAMLAEFESAVDFSTGRKRTIRHYAGAAPCVASHIAGRQRAMLRRATRRDEKGAVAILFNMSTAAAVDAPAIARRGAAALALARALAATRPVTLWACYSAGLHMTPAAYAAAVAATAPAYPKNPLSAVGFCVRLDSGPIDVARAAVWLSDPDFYRSFGFGALKTCTASDVRRNINSVIPPAFNDRDYWNHGGARHLAAAVGADSYVYIPTIGGVDCPFESARGAAGWIKSILESDGAAIMAAA
jgi:hypothetical protein